MGKKHLKDISKIDKAPDGVEVIITSNLESDLLAVESMVESCSTGKCNCMKPEVKEKVTGMEFVRNNQGGSIFIRGGVSVKEIRETIGRSQKGENAAQCCSLSDRESAVDC